MPPERAQPADPTDQDLEDQPAEFRKKDGSISKMRSHRGNVPVLPQTKLCPHCPAKFTRTTHLNRHLRTHTGERIHCCDTCSSQFTRSDLLARHKKRCSAEQDTTRRKSCIPCAESKIRCDGGAASRRNSSIGMSSGARSPCSKCKSRGKECVYAPAPNDKPTHKPTLSQSDGVHSETASNYNSTPPSADPSLAGVFLSSDQMTAMAIPGSSSGTTHSDLLANSFPSPSFPVNRFSNMFPPTLMTAPQPGDQSSFTSAYNSDLFQPFFDGIFSGGSPSNNGAQDANSNASDTSSPELSMFGDLGLHSFFSSFGIIPDHHSLFTTDVPSIQPAISDLRSSNSSPDVVNASSSPLTPEGQHYLYFFFSAFSPQMPIVHGPTFNAEGKPPLLLSAMQACGALYVKTRKATVFIEQTLTNSREVLIQEFSKPKEFTEQLHLIMAVILLQTIGLFHQKPEQRETSTIFHGMLVQMIRRTGLIPTNAGWKPKPIDPSRIDEAWRDWVMFEMVKRLLSQSFLHDCCHAVHLATAPSYRLGEYLAGLPGEPALWGAQTAEEWYLLLQTPNSRYGTVEERLVGPNMRRCLNAMSEVQLLTQPTPVSPFGHFVLAHALLRILFDTCVESRFPTQGNTSDQLSVDKEIHKIQFGLHNWLQSWLASPDLPKMGDPDNEPVFADNALPFYWFGQIALLAYQEGLPPFEPGSPNNLAEVRYKLAKQWFRHIRKFLNESDQGATMFWDELIKIRLKSWQVDKENNVDDSEGVLSFFES